MDDDTNELITQLCTRIGMIMEDSSVAALAVAGMGEDDRQRALADLDAAAKRICSLVEAARSLLG